VAIPSYVQRFWRALDDLFSTVEPTWWGAVVTDGRFPRIWDANYARVDAAAPGLTAADIEQELLPALRAAGSSTEHVVTFRPESSTRLLTELSARGHRIVWDLVMTLTDRVARAVGSARAIDVEELEANDELWGRVAASFELFGVDPDESVDQLRAIETDVLLPGGKRWFGVRDEAGAVVSLAALVLLEDVGYVDNVATFPEARGRGFASAATGAVIDAALAEGVEAIFLLADPDESAVVRMYERIGFRGSGRLASTRGPVPE
jgi:ribosomal protein S18 acetylase RimI-like enzyme